jgi:hypothetical protein
MKGAMSRWHSECPQRDSRSFGSSKTLDEYLFAATPNQAVALSAARLAADSDECLHS